VKAKTKNPLELSASGPMSAFSNYSLGRTQRARRVAVVMMVRPVRIGKAHLLSLRVEKPSSDVNPVASSKNRYAQLVF
jgi:hypothetical protein